MDSLDVAHEVRDWCIGRADDPDYRIVLAGYYEEHAELLERGWRAHRWKTGGGYANRGSGQGKKNRHRETLFISPHCVREGLFD